VLLGPRCWFREDFRVVLGRRGFFLATCRLSLGVICALISEFRLKLGPRGLLIGIPCGSLPVWFVRAA
jgi:hypothetical protein